MIDSIITVVKNKFVSQKKSAVYKATKEQSEHLRTEDSLTNQNISTERRRHENS